MSKPLQYEPCDDDMDPPIEPGKCGAIGSAWPGLAAGEHCQENGMGVWNGLPLCSRHLKKTIGG